MRNVVVFANVSGISLLADFVWLLHRPWNSCLANADRRVRIMVDGAGERVLLQKGSSVPAPFGVGKSEQAATLLPEIALFGEEVVVWDSVHSQLIVVVIVEGIPVSGTQPIVERVIIFLRAVGVVAPIHSLQHLNDIATWCNGIVEQV